MMVFHLPVTADSTSTHNDRQLDGPATAAKYCAQLSRLESLDYTDYNTTIEICISLDSAAKYEYRFFRRHLFRCLQSTHLDLKKAGAKVSVRLEDVKDGSGFDWSEYLVNNTPSGPHTQTPIMLSPSPSLSSCLLLHNPANFFFFCVPIIDAGSTFYPTIRT